MAWNSPTVTHAISKENCFTARTDCVPSSAQPKAVKAHSKQATNHVLCLDPASGKLHATTSDIEEPNRWIYTSNEDPVQVIDPDGTLHGRIRVPEKVANLTFGWLHWDELFITASASVYRIRLHTQGDLWRSISIAWGLTRQCCALTMPERALD
jgi:hypothetical protein